MRTWCRSPAHAVGPVVPGAISTATVGLVRRRSSGASGESKPLVRRIDSRTKKLAMLNADVARLTQEVQRLQQLRDLLREKTMSRAETMTGSVLRTMRVYFDVFRHGYQPHMQTEHAGSMILNDAFLLSVVDEDVVGGGFQGIRTLQDQWTQYTGVFGGPRLRYLDYVVVPLDETEDGDWKALVTATVTHSGHVTLKTIEVLFPHILSDAALVMSLLGRPISGDGRAEFVFDCRAGRIVDIRLDVDMLGTFAPIVENPSDLALLFKLAQLTSECFLGDKDCDRPSTLEEEAPVDLETPLTLAETSTHRRGDPMSMKSILTVEDFDCESDTVEVREVNGII